MNDNKWIDKTSYSQKDKERIPRVWGINVQGIIITVHKYLGYDEEWLLTIPKYNIEHIRLNTENETEAKKKALTEAVRIFTEERSRLDKAIETIIKKQEGETC